MALIATFRAASSASIRADWEATFFIVQLDIEPLRAMSSGFLDYFASIFGARAFFTSGPGRASASPLQLKDMGPVGRTQAFSVRLIRANVAKKCVIIANAVKDSQKIHEINKGVVKTLPKNT